MLKRSNLLIILFLLLSITISGCNGRQKEIHIIPHHLNLKAYSEDTRISLAFVTTYEIDTIDNFTLFLSDDSVGGFVSLDVEEYFELESYKTYSIFVIRLILKDVQGDIHIDSIKYNLNHRSFSFYTDIRIQSEYLKDVHFTTGTDSAAFIIPGFAVYGYEQVLKSNLDVEITNVYFEGTGHFDLNQYVASVLINDNVLVDEVIVNENGPFNLEMVPKDSIPRDTMIIDHIIIEYKDTDGENSDFGYALGPLTLSSISLCGQVYIDSIVNEGN
jgi:hypothetical protein